jgi:hypothetical protein
VIDVFIKFDKLIKLLKGEKIVIEKLIGFILMVINGWAAVIYWKVQGLLFWQATTLLTIYWSLTLLLTYWMTGGVVSLLKKWEPSRVLTEKISEKIKKTKRLNSHKEKKEKIINWLIKKGGIFIGISTFIPLVPELPTLTIIAARIVKMKYALVILLAGNAFRVFVLCYAVYWSLSFLNC